MSADVTPTWHGRHREGAMKAHREAKREEAQQRQANADARRARLKAIEDGTAEAVAATD